MEATLECLLEKEDGSIRLLNDCLKIIKEHNVIIFGAGVGGGQLMKYIIKNNLQKKVYCFSDNNKLKYYNNYYEKIIIPPSKLYEMYSDAFIIIASSAFPQIENQLFSYGYSKNKIKLFNPAFSDFEYTDKQFIYDNILNFSKAYSLLSDDKSREIFINILNYKITKNELWLEKLSLHTDDEYFQYFDSNLVTFTEDDVFVDVGSYIGDTLEKFINLKYKYRNYICFEADLESYKVLLDNIKENDWNNIITYNIGLWDKKDVLTFDNINFGSSSISDDLENGKVKINVDVMDNILDNEIVTFIKMDIEGSEFNALCGMKKCISKYLPTIAVCVYHKRDDFYTLMMQIEKYAPNKYNYYFRQYRYTPTETVCYAIPKT